MKVIVKDEEHEDDLVTSDTPTPIPMAEEDVQTILPPVTPVEDYNCAIIPHAPSPEPFNPVSKEHHTGHSMPERDASQASWVKPSASSPCQSTFLLTSAKHDITRMYTGVLLGAREKTVHGVPQA